MEPIQVLLDSIDKVKEFVQIAGNVECNFDLKSGRFVIDGKSIMGIFSLDLSKPLERMKVTDQLLKRHLSVLSIKQIVEIRGESDGLCPSLCFAVWGIASL